MGREGSQREEGGGGAEAVRFRHPDFALRFYLCKFFLSALPVMWSCIP